MSASPRHIVMLVMGAGVLVGLCTRTAAGDELLYSFEGDLLASDPTSGWEITNPCDGVCFEELANCSLVLGWPVAGGAASFRRWIARQTEPLPESLWVEWGFRSNHPIGQFFFTCDGQLTVTYRSVVQGVYMYGDAAVSLSGDYAVFNLALEDTRSYRLESMDGVHFSIAVDGKVLVSGTDASPVEGSIVQMTSWGGCADDQVPDLRNEWDFVRYGTIAYGERVVSTDPPAGFLDANVHGSVDRFTVTYESPNFVYVDEISVETSFGQPPIVLQTRRLDNGPADTVEIVLDRPLPLGEHTRFVLDDGVVQNVINYSYFLGDIDGSGRLTLVDTAGLFACFGQEASGVPCVAFDFDGNGLVELADVSRFLLGYSGPAVR